MFFVNLKTRKISELCQYVILDNVSQDDPFFIAAALHGGPNTLILTNDLLRQHNYALRDAYLQKMFTFWQMRSQVKLHRNVHDPRTPWLVFPKRSVLRAVTWGEPDENGEYPSWHIPITPFIEKQVPGALGERKKSMPTSLIPPKEWLCIH